MEYLTREEKEAFAIVYIRMYYDPSHMFNLNNLETLNSLAKAGYELVKIKLSEEREERRRRSEIDELRSQILSDTDSKILSDLKQYWPR